MNSRVSGQCSSTIPLVSVLYMPVMQQPFGQCFVYACDATTVGQCFVYACGATTVGQCFVYACDAISPIQCDLLIKLTNGITHKPQVNG